MASPPPSYNISDLVDSNLRNVIVAQRGTGPGNSRPDITGLTAFMYLGGSGCSPTTSDALSLSQAHIQSALSYVNAGTGTVSVCPTARTLLYTAITNNLRAADMTNAKAGTVAIALQTAAYEAARDATAYYMRCQLNATNGSGTILTANNDKVLRQWLDDLKSYLETSEFPAMYANSASTASLDPANTQVDWANWPALMRWVAEASGMFLRYDMSSASSTLVGMGSPTRADGTPNPKYDALAGMIITMLNSTYNAEMQDTVVNVAMRPWLTMYYLYQFASRPEFNIHTQAYALKAMVDAGTAMLTQMMLSYSSAEQGGAEYTTLSALQGALSSNVLQTTQINLDSQVHAVLASATSNRAASHGLGATNAVLGTRLGRTQDLQIRYQVGEAQLLSKRRAMLLWIVALVAVLAASTFLIVTSRLTAFLLMALTTVGVVAAAFTLPALYRFVKRKTNTL